MEKTKAKATPVVKNPQSYGVGVILERVEGGWQSTHVELVDGVITKRDALGPVEKAVPAREHAYVGFMKRMYALGTKAVEKLGSDLGVGAKNGG